MYEKLRVVFMNQKSGRNAENVISFTNGNKRLIGNAVFSRQPEILLISSYPPRECGIATYSQDLVRALNAKFSGSFAIRICAVESESEQHVYGSQVEYKLNTDDIDS